MHNKLCNFFSYVFINGTKREDILRCLQRANLDSAAWILEALRMENAFLDIVGT